jgi:carbon storage regulator
MTHPRFVMKQLFRTRQTSRPPDLRQRLNHRIRNARCHLAMAHLEVVVRGANPQVTGRSEHEQNRQERDCNDSRRQFHSSIRGNIPRSGRLPRFATTVLPFSNKYVPAVRSILRQPPMEHKAVGHWRSVCNLSHRWDQMPLNEGCNMLVLSRKVGEEIVVGEDVRIRTLAIHGNRVRLGIIGPKNVPIHRHEVLCRMREPPQELPPEEQPSNEEPSPP